MAEPAAVTADFFLAMAYRRSGNSIEATRSLNRANTVLDRRNKITPPDRGADFVDWIIAELAHDEAVRQFKLPVKK